MQERCMQTDALDMVMPLQSHLCMIIRASVVARHTPVFLSLNLSSSTGANDFAELWKSLRRPCTIVHMNVQQDIGEMSRDTCLQTW